MSDALEELAKEYDAWAAYFLKGRARDALNEIEYRKHATIARVLRAHGPMLKALEDSTCLLEVAGDGDSGEQAAAQIRDNRAALALAAAKEGT